jgi:ATP-binding cassette, subfamily B, bacterial HlyB/CyaB
VRPAPEELRSMSLFAELGPAELEQVASWFNVEERDSGANLTQQGASGYAFYVLRNGTAAVIQNDEEIRRLGPGDFFGELSIIGDGRRTATVKATSHVTVWNMFGTEFRNLEQHFPELAERIRTAYT